MDERDYDYLDFSDTATNSGAKTMNSEIDSLKKRIKQLEDENKELYDDADRLMFLIDHKGCVGWCPILKKYFVSYYMKNDMYETDGHEFYLDAIDQAMSDSEAMRKSVYAYMFNTRSNAI